MVKINFFGFLSRKKERKTGIKKSKKKIVPVKRKRKKPAIKKEQLLKKTKITAVVTHRFSKIKVAVLKLRSTIKIGDVIRFKGHTTDFTQKVKSLQINHVPIQSARAGQEVGLLVKKRVRIHDKVFIDSEE